MQPDLNTALHLRDETAMSTPINADKTVIINARETTARASQSELDKKTSITRNIHRDLSVNECEWAESIGILGHGLALKVLTFSRPF